MQFIDLKSQYAVLKRDIDAGIARVLTDADYIMGEEVGLLEGELAKYCGVKHCITCANGTDALSIALIAAGIKAGDYVFVPNFTFFASAEAISDLGANPVFVDVDAETFNISGDSLLQQISKLKSKGLCAKAVMTVDLFGQPCDYEGIQRIAAENHLLLIEDSAQGFGGSFQGKKNCSFGDISTTSFFPAKPLGCYGDGGAIFTDNDRYASLIKSLRVHGKGEDKYDNVRLGYNSRLDTLQAAVLLPKLKAFKRYELDKRNEFALMYTEKLKGYVQTPKVIKNSVSSWAQYTIILKDESQRNSIQMKLKEQDIPSMIYYPRTMVQQAVYKDYLYEEAELFVSNCLVKKILALPMHAYLKEDDINTVCKTVIECVKSR